MNATKSLYCKRFQCFITGCLLLQNLYSYSGTFFFKIALCTVEKPPSPTSSFMFKSSKDISNVGSTITFFFFWLFLLCHPYACVGLPYRLVKGSLSISAAALPVWSMAMFAFTLLFVSKLFSSVCFYIYFTIFSFGTSDAVCCCIPSFDSDN